MNKLLCALLLIATASIATPALAQSSTSAASEPTAKKTVKKPVKKAKKKTAKAAAATPAVVAGDDDDDNGEMNIESSIVTHYDCELGNKIVTYVNPGDEKYLAIRWKDKIQRLRRVGTTTGANRFENKKYGLVWINIPSKAMLLDSKKGQQLANECRNPDQAKAFAAKKG
jgi:membrane-bound inhibitor of C-type lysozyme